MKQVPSDKYNIAWFKLAECVARGEKERAFGVYRLLAHSFENPAYVHQLQGDLLLSFDEHDQALEHYLLAANCYENQKCLVEAAAVYEHLVTLEPESATYLSHLIDLYKELNVVGRITELVDQLCATFVKDGHPIKASTLLNRYDALLVPKMGLKLHQRMVFTLLKPKTKHIDQALIHIRKTIDGLMKNANDKQLQMFLSKLEALDNDCYLDACTYLEKV